MMQSNQALNAALSKERALVKEMQHDIENNKATFNEQYPQSLSLLFFFFFLAGAACSHYSTQDGE